MYGLQCEVDCILPRFRGFRLRKSKKEAEEKEQQIRLEEKKRVEEERRLYERLISLRTDYRILENYPLYDPWARALILERKTDGSIIYFVDEIPLTSEERQIYERIMDILYWELEPAPSGVDPVEHFKNQASSIIKRFALRFKSTIHPGISWGKIEYYILRDTIEYDVITPLMRDPAIEDISCDGVGKPVYVWHQRYESIPTNIRFTREEDLDSLVVKLAHKAGKHVSVAFPIVDAILPEGHRLAATFKKEVSRHGSTFTIRKFREKPLSIVDLIRGGTVSSDLAAYFWKLMEYNMTGLIMGVTGAGKTTLLNAIATLLRPTIKIVTIEDTPELRLTHENWVQLYSRPSYGFEAGLAEITLYDLVRVSLRYRPDVLIVGEVRGEEAKVLFQAIASVGWDTPIVIRDLATGEVRVIPIGEFVDQYYVRNEERIAKDVYGYEILTFDGEHVKWEPIVYVLRHMTREVYRIEAEDGLELETTGNHSVFVIDEETLELKTKRVDELQPGDLLVSFMKEIPSTTLETINHETIIAVAGGGSLLYKLENKNVINESTILDILNSFKHREENVINTSSRDEAAKISWMLRLKGLHTRIIEDSKGFKVIVSNKIETEKHARIPAKAIARLAKLLGLTDLIKTDARLIDGVTARQILRRLKDELGGEEATHLYKRIITIIREGLRIIEVKAVVKDETRDRFVYDVSVLGSERFFGGNIPVLLHNTGHGGITTIHAEHIDAAVKRLTSPPMDIPPGYIPLVNFAMAIKRVRLPTGAGTHRIVRRVTEVWEIRDYEDYPLVARWDPASREHYLNLEESILIPRIAEMTGQEVSEVIEDIKMRETVLRWMAVKGVTKYEEVSAKIMEYYRRPEKVYRETYRELERLERYT